VREGNHLILDCADLRFIDSTGMAGILRLCKGLGPSGRLTLRALPTAVAKAAHILGLDRVPNLELSPATAEAAAAG
jgi:anti-anti-sigma factor